MAYPEIEFRNQEEIKLFQDEELRKLLDYLQEKSGYYNQFFRKHKIDISTIRHC